MPLSTYLSKISAASVSQDDVKGLTLDLTNLLEKEWEECPEPDEYARIITYLCVGRQVCMAGEGEDAPNFREEINHLRWVIDLIERLRLSGG